MVDGTTCRKTSEIHAVVPYQGRGRAEHEVHLDPESLRMWNQLVKIYSGVDEEKEDGEREQWWRRELLTFQGRIDLFISLLHQVLGTFILATITLHHSKFGWLSLELSEAFFFFGKISLRKDDTLYHTFTFQVFLASHPFIYLVN
jgi:hypothetical protein